MAVRSVGKIPQVPGENKYEKAVTWLRFTLMPEGDISPVALSCQLEASGCCQTQGKGELQPWELDVEMQETWIPYCTAS